MLAILTVSALSAACGDDNEGPADAGVPDAGFVCVTNPTTNDEIINACTTSVGIDKHPVLPLLNPDGGLPPLP